MDFDFSTETITPDTTSILTIGGNGGLELPSGTTAQRPVSGLSNGALRYNTDNTGVEWYSGGSWATAGSVSSVAITGSTGLTVGSSPITTSGTITLTLGAELQGLSALSANGIVARTGSGTYASRTIAGTASNITVTNGDGVSGAPTINLATIGTPVSASFVKITTDTFGRVSATTAVTTADITALVGNTYVDVTGDTMTGNLIMSGGATVTGLPTPVASSDAVSKSYADSLIQGLSWKQSVIVATTGNITLSGTQTIDGVAVIVGQRVLVKSQSASANNGIYLVAAGAWSRSPDSTSAAQIDGSAVYVQQGTVNADTGWTVTSTVVTVGTDPIIWAQFSGSGSYSAGAGLTLTGNIFSLTSPVVPSLGGTGTTTTPTSGQVLVGTSGGIYTPATVASGSGITVTAGSGTLSIANSGVLSNVAGTGISVSGATGNVTITNTGVTSIAGTAGNITASAATGAVTLNLATAGTSGTYGVVTTDTFGRVTSGTVIAPIANGGTGLGTLGTANQILGVNTGATGLEYKTVTAGTGISVTPAAGAITINNTGVTSVGLSLPSFITVTNSPVTTTGTLTGTLASQTANTAFIAPNGSAGAPTFRLLAYADLPIKLLVENPSTPTAPLAAGTNALALGSGSSAPGTQGVAIGAGTSATLFGSKAFANGNFATAGDAQSLLMVARAITTTNASTELFLDGATATQRMVMPNNSVWTYEIKVSCRRTDATGGVGAWTYSGCIYRDATAGSTQLATNSKTVITRLGMSATFDPTISADTTNGALRITVTAANSQTWRWVATATINQVTN